MIDRFDEKRAIQALKDEMTRRWNTGAEPRSEYQSDRGGKRIEDAGLAHLRDLIRNGVGK